MSKPKIKFKLVKFDKAIAFQILEQDERFRATNKKNLTYSGRPPLMVKSVSFPLLDNDGVFLRGFESGNDSHISFLTFKSNKERDDYAASLLDALRDWAENAPEFAEDKQVVQSTEPDTYQF